MIKTVSLTADTETKVEISGGYNVGVINRTTGMLYASKNSGISAGADDVAAIPAGDSYVIRAADDTVYLLATAAGDVQLESIGAKEVFKIAAARSSSGGGEGGTVDEVARQAISSHANNDEIHLTAEDAIEAAATAISNPNLLINPDLKINQRGQTEWSTGNTTNVYTVDGWYSKRSNITTNGEGLSVAWDGVNGTEGWIQQKIETTALFGRTATLSFCVDGETFVVTDAMPAVADTSKYVTLSENIVAAFTNHAGESASVVILYKSAMPVTIEWAKLELGSIATPFTPPNPATELAKCQRYYQIRTTGDIDPVDLRPSMRITPTVTQLDDSNYEYNAEL